MSACLGPPSSILTATSVSNYGGLLESESVFATQTVMAREKSSSKPHFCWQDGGVARSVRTDSTTCISIQQSNNNIVATLQSTKESTQSPAKLCGARAA